MNGTISCVKVKVPYLLACTCVGVIKHGSPSVWSLHSLCSTRHSDLFGANRFWLDHSSDHDLIASSMAVPPQRIDSANGYHVEIFPRNVISDECVKAASNMLSPLFWHEIPEITKVDLHDTPSKLQLRLHAEDIRLEMSGNKLTCGLHPNWPCEVCVLQCCRIRLMCLAQNLVSRAGCSPRI